MKRGIKRGHAAVGELLSFYFCMKEYLASDFSEAGIHANKLTREDYALGQVARAVTFHRREQTEKGEAKPSKHLLMTDKVWQRYPALELGKTFYKDAIAKRLMADLRAAGLP